MSNLASDLRNLLERTVVEARDVAELGARAALEALGIGDGKVPPHLEPAQRDLRLRLRARARQLGDPLDAKTQTQGVDHLVREVAYEHWHRMLFARFLAESHLLVEPDSGVAVSLDEVRELARERGEDPWALAGRFAERMLPAIFRSNDPSLALELPPERLNRLEALLEELPAEIFQADDALGWVYQFWQKEEKARVNRAVKSGLKIGAEELPAVTQLFTEPYMVQFLLHNTLGAWHAGKVLAARPELATDATSEEELRRGCALPGYEWTYLRFVRDPVETGPWRPAAGTFPGWPERAAEVTFLDPCCGSGHFLVEALAALVALRRHEEGLDLPAAVRAVLADNLHGLEIDPRCTQLAAFAVAFAAWRTLGRVEPLPPVHIACSGLAVGLPRQEWTKLAGDDPELRRGMERLHDLFQQAPTLGSLLDPQRELGRDLYTASIERLEGQLLAALEDAGLRDATTAEVAVTAAGMAMATEILLAKHTLVSTNVPYLGRKGQDAVLSRFAEVHYPDAKADLAAVFVHRLLGFLRKGGTAASVSPQNWQFLGNYSRFRRHLLSAVIWNLNARLGSGAFITISGEVVNVALVAMTQSAPAKNTQFLAIDAASEGTPEAKAELLRGERAPSQTDAHVGLLSQGEQLDNPDARIALGERSAGSLMGVLADGFAGVQTGDFARFGRVFWELPRTDRGWALQQTTVSETREFGGMENLLLWEGGRGQLYESVKEKLGETGVGAWLRGEEAWGRLGVCVSSMGALPVAIYTGALFDNNAAVVAPKNPKHLPALWAFCSSPEFSKAVRQIDQKLNVTNATLVKVPFDLAHWERVAKERYPNGLPEPWSEDPTQWIFHGHPARAEAALQVAVARLLGYRWPAELDPGMRLSAEARAWVERSEKLLPFADPDGIVCLSSLRNEEPAAARLRALLASAFGSDWSAAKERELLAATPGQAASLEQWLCDRFFEEHCALFHQRPFIWHLWDGRRDGFHVLVNYHRLAEGNGKGRQLLEALTYAYLGEWIDRQRRGAAAGETGAEARLAAALELQGELAKILEGEAPFDVFVRWKPLHRQAIGWEPDIDDGVRLNSRPFLTASLSGGRAGAGLFRARPGIHWRKDRGAEPRRDAADFPWFWKDGAFHGERHNDLHLSLDEKRRAREAKSEGGGKR